MLTGLYPDILYLYLILKLLPFPNHGFHLTLCINYCRERQSEYSISVRATDGGESANSGELVVRINVTDVNDHSPVFNNTTYSITGKTCVMGDGG